MKYLIEGGNQLKGQVKIFGAKNSVFKLMLAACLSNEIVTIANISFVRNVFVVKEIIESLGGVVELSETDRVAKISAVDMNLIQVPLALGQESRASSMIVPILLHRFGSAKVPLPGGDQIGARSLDRHFKGLEKLGAKVTLEGEHIMASCSERLIGSDYHFEKNTHTGTETLILAATLARGTTRLTNVALEPEVDDLISFLNKLGADITREKNRTIVINGVSQLRGGSYSAMPDQNEAVTFACAALATKGDVVVLEAKKEHLQAFLEKVLEAGGGVEETESGIRFYYKGSLKSTDVETAPYPGFKTDWQALWVTLMTQATGESTIHETVYESRFGYVQDLKNMGAKIKLFNPKVKNPDKVYNFNLSDAGENPFHAARVIGPTELTGRRLVVNDIRAGATLTLASLIASGESTIENIEMIERGYEKLEERLKSLGAQIEKVE